MSEQVLKLGSLFDGSGGFPLAATLLGIEPVWASEVEPFPIMVTSKRFPRMRHVGDVTRLDGAKLPPVDIVTFGSPCQDLSIAGQHKGLQGDKSSLFFHAVRVIKEMREATNGKYPKYAVWENVPGAFSSNQRRDFTAVLTTLIHITNPQAPEIPTPERWARADVIVAAGSSIAWRTLDAQFWSVPQHRERIFLVCDFTSERAGQILFESPCVCRDFTACSDKESQNPVAAGPNIDQSSQYVINDHGGEIMAVTKNISATLRAQTHGHAPIVFDNHAQDARYEEVGISPTVTARVGTGEGNLPIVVNCAYSLHPHMDRKPGGVLAKETSIARTLDAKSPCPNRNQGGTAIITPCAKARYLTPQECAKLQGFPHWWGQTGLSTPNPTSKEISFWIDVWNNWQDMRGKKRRTEKQIRKWLTNPHTDSAEYKMWGNGVALPCVKYVLEQIKNDCYNAP